jgi:hypothetical protein
MSKRLEETIEHLRSDVAAVDEPQFKAMFETAAEVIGGLVAAFKHYEQKSEKSLAQLIRNDLPEDRSRA